MKKTIMILLLTALCMTVLTSCDFGNGLVTELFGGLNQGNADVDPVVDILETVVDMDPVDQATEIEPGYAEVVGQGFLSVSRQYSWSEYAAQLLSEQRLENWDGKLKITDAGSATLTIVGYVAYNGSDEVEYFCNVYAWYGDDAMTKLEVQKITPDQDMLDKIGEIQAEHLDVFLFSIPYDAIEDRVEITVLGVGARSSAVVFRQDIAIEKEIESGCDCGECD